MELDELLKLIRAVSDSELTGFKYEAEGVCLNLKKEKEVVTAVQTLPAAGVSQSVMPLQAVAASAMSEASADSEEKAAGTKEAEQKGFLVKSPLVGTFYAAPAEDAAGFSTFQARIDEAAPRCRVPCGTAREKISHPVFI